MKSIGLIMGCLLTFWAQAQGLTASEKQLILSGDTATALQVLPLSDPAGARALRAVSANIDVQDPLVHLLAARMLKAVQDSNHRGVGIAAPQVGINRRLIWVQRFDKKDQPFQCFINPEIIWRSQLLIRGAEGDLSFEGYGDVVRHYMIRIAHTDSRSGQRQEEVLEGFTAVIFQHETDHLSGILFTDRIKEQQHKKYVNMVSERAQQFLREAD